MWELKAANDEHLWKPQIPSPHTPLPRTPQNLGPSSNQCMTTLGFFCAQVFSNTMPGSPFFLSFLCEVSRSPF